MADVGAGHDDGRDQDPSRAAPAPRPVQGRQRQVALPGGKQSQKQRRLGLAGLGLVLVLGSGFGFWFILTSIDERREYLMAARTIQRWDVARASDFVVVEANVGTASALAADQSGLVVGRWATGRIPAGTLITAGLFERPPLSSESEADKVWMRVTLPSGDSPSGSFSPGDTIALIGRESSGPDGAQAELSLIGVLQLEVVQGDELHYVVTPQEALQIRRTVDRYGQASDSFIWPLGFDLSAEDVVAALAQQTVGAAPAAAGTPAGAAPAFGAVQGQ